jgi:hypothetical protein
MTEVSEKQKKSLREHFLRDLKPFRLQKKGQAVARLKKRSLCLTRLPTSKFGETLLPQDCSFHKTGPEARTTGLPDTLPDCRTGFSLKNRGPKGA